jgi:hypothetical protein
MGKLEGRIVKPSLSAREINKCFQHLKLHASFVQILKNSLWMPEPIIKINLRGLRGLFV